MKKLEKDKKLSVNNLTEKDLAVTNFNKQQIKNEDNNSPQIKVEGSCIVNIDHNKVISGTFSNKPMKENGSTFMNNNNGGGTEPTYVATTMRTILKREITPAHLSSEMLYSPLSSSNFVDKLQQETGDLINSDDKQEQLQSADNNDTIKVLHKQKHVTDSFTHTNIIAQRLALKERSIKTPCQQPQLKAKNALSKLARQNQSQTDRKVFSGRGPSHQQFENKMHPALRQSQRTASQTATSGGGGRRFSTKGSQSKTKMHRLSTTSPTTAINEQLKNSSTNMFNSPVIDDEKDPIIDQKTKQEQLFQHRQTYDNLSIQQSNAFFSEQESKRQKNGGTVVSQNKRKRYLKRKVKSPKAGNCDLQSPQQQLSPQQFEENQDYPTASLLRQSYHPDQIYTVSPDRVVHGAKNMIDAATGTNDSRDFNIETHQDSQVISPSLNTRSTRALSKLQKRKVNKGLGQGQKNPSELRNLLGITDINYTNTTQASAQYLTKDNLFQKQAVQHSVTAASTNLGNFLVHLSPAHKLNDSIQEMEHLKSMEKLNQEVTGEQYFKKNRIIEKPTEYQMLGKNPNWKREQKDRMIQTIYKPTHNRNLKNLTLHTNQVVRHDQNIGLLTSLGIPKRYMIAKEHYQIQSPLNQSKVENTQRIKSANKVNQPKGSKGAKSQSQFVKREREFKKAFNKQVSEWRKEAGPVVIPDYMQGKKSVGKEVDISLYKERDDNYKVIGNRIMARSKEPTHRYVNKNVKVIQDTFDPLRIRIRVMPMSRSPAIRSKNSDFYFIEAQKLSLRGDLTEATKMLKKGLEIKPCHFLCRFNHGVIMFKFGLITEAIQDFKFLTKNYPKESWAFLNLAICLVQVGKPRKEKEKYVSAEYTEAIEMCIHAIKVSENSDTQLKVDAYHLRAMCHYRLHEPLLAVKYFIVAKRINQQSVRNKRVNNGLYSKDEYTTQRLEQQLTDLLFAEYGAEFTEAEHMDLSLKRSNSFDWKTKQHLPKQYLARNYSTCGQIKEYHQNLKVGVKNIEARIQQSSQLLNKELTSSKQDEKEEEKTSTVESMSSTSMQMERKVQVQIESVKTPTQSHKDKTDQDDNASHYSRCKTLKVKPASPMLVPNNNEDNGDAKQEQNKEKTQPALNKLSALIGSQLKKKIKLNIQNEIKKLKIKLMSQNGLLKDINTSEELFQQYYQEMLERQIDEVDGHNPKLRCRQMYLQFQKGQGNGNDHYTLNDFELAELENRKKLEIWVNTNTELISYIKEEIRKGIYKDMNASFIELLLKITNIKNRNALPDDAEEGLSSIIEKQDQLEKMMGQLVQSFGELQRIWDRELHINDIQIYSQNVIRPKEKYGVKNLEKEDDLIDKLKEALTSVQMTSDDVCNFLENDLDEKEKLKQQIQFKLTSDKRRLPFLFMRFIERQFNMEPETRDIYQIDMVLRNLKYFQLYKENQRLQMYQWAKFVKFPAQHVLFKEGDIGRHFYIIIKGRVGVVIQSEKYGKQIVNVLHDGDQFGELSLINLTELNHQVEENSKSKQVDEEEYEESISGQSSSMGSQQSKTNQTHISEVQQFSTRKATIITYEDTEMLEIAHEYAKIIYQPEHVKEVNEDRELKDFFMQLTKQESKKSPTKVKRMTTKGVLFEQKNADDEIKIAADEIEAFDSGRDEEENKEEELAKKITFLKSIKLFEDISTNELLPLALNLKEQVFKYGEFLQKANEIPKAMYIIKSGQCKVCSTRIANREIHSSLKNKTQKKTIQDKNPLFMNFDPDNTLLNEVKSRDKEFQNSRVYVTEKGEQVKGQIMYHDHQVFSQLMPKNYFGGRVITPFELYMQLRKVYFGYDYIERPRCAPTEEQEPEEKYQMKSFLNVIADSYEVVVYVIDRQTIGFLNDQRCKEVFDQIIQEKEPDRPNTEDKLNKKTHNWIDWQNEKVKLTKKILVEMYREKYRTALSI